MRSQCTYSGVRTKRLAAALDVREEAMIIKGLSGTIY